MALFDFFVSQRPFIGAILYSHSHGTSISRDVCAFISTQQLCIAAICYSVIAHRTKYLAEAHTALAQVVDEGADAGGRQSSVAIRAMAPEAASKS